MLESIKKYILRGGVGRDLTELYVKSKHAMSKKEFEKEREKYNELCKRPEFIATRADEKRYLYDAGDQAGDFSTYFFQDLLAAQLIFRDNPNVHYDIGSRLDGFVAHLLSFRQGKRTVMIDIRPLDIQLSGLDFLQADATNLENILDDSIESLSTLHAVEHFGLGRYGDPIDPEACFKAIKALQRVIMPGGRLYFAVPIGPEDKCIFNANRVFNPYTISDSFDRMSLQHFYHITSKGISEVSLNVYYQGKVNETIRQEDVGLFVLKKDTKNGDGIS